MSICLIVEKNEMHVIPLYSTIDSVISLNLVVDSVISLFLYLVNNTLEWGE